jgi:hypothetical protein
MFSNVECSTKHPNTQQSASNNQHRTRSDAASKIFLVLAFHFPDDNASEKSFGDDKTFPRVAFGDAFPPFMIIDGKTKAINSMKQFVMSAGTSKVEGDGVKGR